MKTVGPALAPRRVVRGQFISRHCPAKPCPCGYNRINPLFLIHRCQLRRIAPIRIPFPEIDRSRATHVEIVPMDKGLSGLIKRLKDSIDICRLTPAWSADHLFRFPIHNQKKPRLPKAFSRPPFFRPSAVVSLSP